MRKTTQLEDEIDAEQTFQMQMGLGQRGEREIMQRVSFSDSLIDQLHKCLGANIDRPLDPNDNMTDSTQDKKDHYQVLTGKYNIQIAQSILDKTITVPSVTNDPPST
jgi:hypothetical protein